MVTGAGRDLVVGKEGGLLLSNGIMSATVPLLLEEDIELGSPPSYKEAVDGERTLQNRSLQRHWRQPRMPRSEKEVKKQLATIQKLIRENPIDRCLIVICVNIA
ncbi:hypothetical protein WUBG_09690 [Wuchereria bancrofti]|uniref:Uncharacterized protein n=1 Tax=Wuchereria bancrofti TaxID=6293 RepID=J9EQQ0_WUCBA|nr:hypothetical protein WUBG_09690 [Wuchereria bancrofti]